MAIDASIPLGVKPFQPPDQMNMLAQVLGVKQAQTQGDLAQYSLGKAKRGDEETNRMAQLISSGVDVTTPEGQAKLYAVAPTQAAGYMKGVLENRNLQSTSAAHDAKAAADRQATAKAGYGAFQMAIGSHLNNPNATREDVLNSVQQLVDARMMNPVDAANMSKTLPQDQGQLRGYLQRAISTQMTPEQLLTIFAPKATEVTSGQQKFFRDTNPNSPTYGQMTAGAPVQMQATPGEVQANQLGYARLGEEKRHHGSLEANASATLAAGKWQYDADRGGLVNMQTGEFKPAMQGGQPLGPKDKGLNDTQAKANLFGTRMQEADKVLTQMASKGVLRPGATKGVAEAVGNIAGLGTEALGGALSDAAGSLTNWTQSTEQQQVEQAQRDFINAALRRESGASISPAEFRNANKQYFPQPNDDPPTLAQKARNRQIATEGILAEVPEGKRTKVAPSKPEGSWDPDKERRYQEWKARQGK